MKNWQKPELLNFIRRNQLSSRNLKDNCKMKTIKAVTVKKTRKTPKWKNNKKINNRS